MDSTTRQAKFTLPSSLPLFSYLRYFTFFPQIVISNPELFSYDIRITVVITGNPFFCIVTLKLSHANL